MADFLTFKAYSDYFKDQFTEQLATNMQMYLDWAFLEANARGDVTLPSSGAYGANQATLRYVDDPNFFPGQVWEGFRSNWAYENGLTVGNNPIQISGIYISGIFHNTATTGTLSYYINYPLGRVVFNNPIDSLNLVQVEYSYKWVKVETCEVPWFQQIQFNSLRIDNPTYLQTGSGLWTTLGQSRVQLPAVVIEPTAKVRLQGQQLGGGQYRFQDVLFHVIAETPWDRNKVSDALLTLKDKTLFFIDTNLAYTSGVFPLDANGSLVPSGLMYPQLNAEPPNGYRNRRCFLYDVVSEDNVSDYPLYWSTVRLTCQLYNFGLP